MRPGIIASAVSLGLVQLTLVLSLTVLSSSQIAFADDDTYWSDKFYLSGLAIPYEGRALAVVSGNLIAGGSFEHADGLPTQNIAYWNGITWSPMGAGLDSCAYALVEFHSELYAGVRRDTDSTNTVVKWSGSSWTPVGTGLFESTMALAVYRDTLYAAGDFLLANGSVANHIAKWTGSDWLPVGSGVQSHLFTGATYALAVYEGSLIVGGEFDSVDNVAAKNIARWDGSNWYPLGVGVGDTALYTSKRVEALIVHNSSLIAAGGFLEAGGSPANYIAAWNGSAWSALGSGLPDYAHALGTYTGNLMACGSLPWQPSGSNDAVFRWDGAQWQVLGAGANGGIYALTEYGGDLVALGDFSIMDGIVAHGIAAWNGSAWSPVSSRLGQGLSVNDGFRDISAFSVFSGTLVAGGDFATAGDQVTNNIAAWDGINWQPLGLGTTSRITDPSDASVVQAMETSGTDLYVGGRFDSAGGQRVNNIARWDGAAWHPLGTGVADFHLSASVGALVSYDGDLIAGGSFDSAGGLLVHSIARWDGASWHAIGSGIGSRWYDEWSYSLGSVHAMASYDLSLIVGGSFDSAGGVLVRNIARWDGAQWYSLAGGITGQGGLARVKAMTIYDGALIVAGGFDSAGGVAANCIARWDGITWRPLGSDLHFSDSGNLPEVTSLAVRNGYLYAGGEFDSVGSLRAYRVARWDGAHWYPLGSGVEHHSERVTALHAFGGSLFLGGDEMYSVGGKASALIAEWTGPDTAACPITIPGDVNVSGEVRTSDIIYLVNYVFKEGPIPLPCAAVSDINCDGKPTPADIISLVNYVFKGGPAPCDVCTLIPGTWTCP